MTCQDPGAECFDKMNKGHSARSGLMGLFSREVILVRKLTITMRALFITLLVLTLYGGVYAADMKTQNVIFVMTDGFRWQEVFRGADAGLIIKENCANDEAACRKAYWRDDQSERRQALMPFFWSVVAKHGQVYGNRDIGSASRVENPYWFSYPGYSETFCGYVDTGVNSNNPVNNPNVSVFEWLGRKPEYKNRIAAFMAWDALPYILNRDRAGFFINASLEPVKGNISANQELLNKLKSETVGFHSLEAPDSITFYSALEYLKQNKPRVFYLSLGWTDEAGHAGQYDEYLKAARLSDDYMRILWDTVQSMRQYKGKTTLILATDHGRGEVNWKSHGASIAGSDQNWMAFMGPDTPALGERRHVQEVTSSHIAATLAALLGEDYCAAQPKAGRPISDVVKVE